MFGSEPDEVQAQIRRRYANKETVAGAERRIEMIALDIANHFKAKVRPNGFKAQVVAPSRAAALRYAERLNELRRTRLPHRYGRPLTTGPSSTPRETSTRSRSSTPSSTRRGSRRRWSWSTCCSPASTRLWSRCSTSTVPLREHGLLQAIARVNRRFSHEQDGVPTEKEYGLIVDYHGVSRDLEEALSTFEWPDVQDAMRELEEDPAPVIESAAVHAESHFRGRDLNDTWACVAVFAPDASTEGDYKADLFEAFNADYRQLSRLMDRFLPDPRAPGLRGAAGAAHGRYAPTCGRSSCAMTRTGPRSGRR